MDIKIPRILLSGLSGGSGKTFISLALSRAWTRKNFHVQPYKKGPDYIDATWLSLACRNPCYCLDPFFLEDEDLKHHFVQNFTNNFHDMINTPPCNNIALIEGNRGLFDGKDVQGSCSSAHLAKLLDCPVIVSINCTKMTRTVAALVMGLQHFDKDLKLAGVILNNTGSQRHAKLVQESVEYYTDIPVLGVLPRMQNNPIPERHMGLHLHKDDTQKQNEQHQLLNNLADFLEEHIDIDIIHKIASNQRSLKVNQRENDKRTLEANVNYDIHTSFGEQQDNNLQTTPSLNIAYFYDDALWFYYEENLQELQKKGANLIPLSILDETPLQDQIEKNKRTNTKSTLDGLYIGGGFPELYALDISKSPHLKTLQTWIEDNMPVYAECGGFMLLSKALHIPPQSLESRSKKSIEIYNQTTLEKEIFPMAHIFEAETEFFLKPQGLGYIIAQTLQENPFHPLNSIWHGHEFHFSKSIKNIAIPFNHYILGLKKGHGMEKAQESEKIQRIANAQELEKKHTIQSTNQNEKDNDFQGLDGLLYKQCFASYAHLFAPAVPHWAENFIKASNAYRQGKKFIAK